MGGNCEPWLIALDIMSSSGYVRWCLLNKYIFHLWGCLADMWMQMNKDQVGSMWRYLYSYNPGIIFQVVLESIIKSKSESGLVQEVDQTLLEPIKK